MNYHKDPLVGIVRLHLRTARMMMNIEIGAAVALVLWYAYLKLASIGGWNWIPIIVITMLISLLVDRNQVILYTRLLDEGFKPVPSHLKDAE